MADKPERQTAQMNFHVPSQRWLPEVRPAVSTPIGVDRQALSVAGLIRRSVALLSQLQVRMSLCRARRRCQPLRRLRRRRGQRKSKAMEGQDRCKAEARRARVPKTRLGNHVKRWPRYQLRAAVGSSVASRQRNIHAFLPSVFWLAHVGVSFPPLAGRQRAIGWIGRRMKRRIFYHR